MFFLNPFSSQFNANWEQQDERKAVEFVLAGSNSRNGDQVFSNFDPGVTNTFNLASTDSNGGDKSILKIRFAHIINNYASFNTMTVDIAGATPAATTPSEIVTILNADSLFSTFFTAELDSFNKKQLPARIAITSKKQGQLKFYVTNSGAEEVLKFNKYAIISDIPSYYVRNSVDQFANYTNCTAELVQLSHFITGNTVAASTVVTSVGHGLTTGDIITIAGSDSTPSLDGDQTITRINDDTFSVAVTVTVVGTTGVWARAIDADHINDSYNANKQASGLTLAGYKEDYELLYGRSGFFIFKKITVDGDDRITQIIEYKTGSVAGDKAKKTTYAYTSSNLNPDKIMEVPYILTSSDLIAP